MKAMSRVSHTSDELDQAQHMRVSTGRAWQTAHFACNGSELVRERVGMNGRLYMRGNLYLREMYTHHSLT